MINFTQDLISTIPSFGDLIITVGENITIEVYSPQMKATYVLDQVQIGETEGRYLLSSKATAKLKALSTPGGVAVTFGEKRATFSSSKGKFYENYIDIAVAEYSDTYQEPFEVKGQFVKNALGFVSKNQLKAIFTGVNVSPSHVLATDMFKLYLAGSYNQEGNVTLIASFAQLVSNYETVSISRGERSVKMVAPDGWTYISNILDGSYPSVTGVIRAFDVATPIESNLEFFDALKLASMSGEMPITICYGSNSSLIVKTEEFEKQVEGLDVPSLEDMTITISKESAKELCKFPGKLGYMAPNRPLVCLREEDKVLLLPLAK